MQNYKRIFHKHKIYLHDSIYAISDKYNLVVTDCIKGDRELTIGLCEEDEPRWEFELVGRTEDYPLKFQLRWPEFL